MDLKEVTTFLESDEAGKKWLQSYVDSRVTGGINTWKDNNLAKLLKDHADAEISKRYPAETDEQKRLKDLENRLAQSEQARSREALRNLAITHATQKGLPVDIADHFVGQDEQTTLEMLAKLEAVWSPAVESAVEGRFKALGRAPARPDMTPAGTITGEQIRNMTPAERIERWPEISKAMTEGRVKAR